MANRQKRLERLNKTIEMMEGLSEIKYANLELQQGRTVEIRNSALEAMSSYDGVLANMAPYTGRRLQRAEVEIGHVIVEKTEAAKQIALRKAQLKSVRRRINEIKQRATRKRLDYGREF